MGAGHEGDGWSEESTEPPGSERGEFDEEGEGEGETEAATPRFERPAGPPPSSDRAAEAAAAAAEAAQAEAEAEALAAALPVNVSRSIFTDWGSVWAQTCTDPHRSLDQTVCRSQRLCR